MSQKFALGVVAVAVAVAVTVLAGEVPARADVLDFNAELHAGAAGGWGLAGAHKNDSFAAATSGAAYGARVGIEFLYLDAWIEHNQFVGSGGLLGTWTQFMTGLDFDFDVGTKTRGGHLDAKGHRVGSDRYSPVYTEFGFAIGFGVGTGQQVQPPLDNAQVSDKGFLGQVTFGLGYRFNRAMSVDLTVPLEYAYMFKSGPGIAANDTASQYQSLQASALVGFRIDLGLH